MDRVKQRAIMLVIVLFVCGSAWAQTAFNLTKQQADNQSVLRGYQWQSRTEIRVKGKVWQTVVFLMRYDSDGKMVETQVGGSQTQASGTGVDFTQSNSREIRQNRVEDLVGAADVRAREYATLAPEQARAALQKAQREPGKGELAGTQRLMMKGVLQPDDTVSVWVDTGSGIQRRMEVQSTARDESFKAVWTFSKLKDGPWYPARRVIEIPSREVQAVTTNSDYLR
jgi:hypothetical protein